MLVKVFGEVADDSPGGRDHEGCGMGAGRLAYQGKRGVKAQSWEAVGICMLRERRPFELSLQ